MFQLQESKTVVHSLEHMVPVSKDPRYLCSDASVSMEVQTADCNNGKKAVNISNGITAISHLNNAKLESICRGGIAILDFGSQFGKVAGFIYFC